jgi:hypothetical protein
VDDNLVVGIGHEKTRKEVCLVWYIFCAVDIHTHTHTHYYTHTHTHTHYTHTHHTHILLPVSSK